MEDIEFIEYKKVDLPNSLLVIAFPTVGMISSIAGHFIIDSLNLKEIGAIISAKFYSATVIHKSKPFHLHKFLLVEKVLIYELLLQA